VEIDPAPLLRALVGDWRAGIAPGRLSAWFHLAVADALVSVALLLRERTRINVVALSGGVFQNRLLVRTTRQRLAARGFEVLTHQQVPPNDGGIALGQAVIAQFQLA
jgi:hydrogenase maturation protein HypF